MQVADHAHQVGTTEDAEYAAFMSRIGDRCARWCQGTGCAYTRGVSAHPDAHAIAWWAAGGGGKYQQFTADDQTPTDYWDSLLLEDERARIRADFNAAGVRASDGSQG